MPTGTLDTVELEPRHAEVARETFAGRAWPTRVRVHVGPALEICPTLGAGGPSTSSSSTPTRRATRATSTGRRSNLRSGGIVLLDNAFLFGHLPEAPRGDRAASIKAMQTVHETLARGGLFRATVLPTGEGLAMGVRV